MYTVNFSQRGYYYWLKSQLYIDLIWFEDSQKSSPRRALRTLEWGASGSPLMALSRHISAALISVSSAVSICSGSQPITPTPLPESAVLSEARVIGFRESTNSISDKGDALWRLKYSLLSSFSFPLFVSSGHGVPSRPAQLTSSIPTFDPFSRFCWMLGSNLWFTPALFSFREGSQGDFGDFNISCALLALRSVSEYLASFALSCVLIPCNSHRLQALLIAKCIIHNNF